MSTTSDTSEPSSHWFTVLLVTMEAAISRRAQTARFGPPQNLIGKGVQHSDICAEQTPTRAVGGRTPYEVCFAFGHSECHR